MKFGNAELHILTAATGMDPEEQLVQEIEAQLEGQGWDQRPTYLALGRNRSGLAASTLPMPEICYEDPSGALPRYVDWLRGAQLNVTPEQLEELEAGSGGLIGSYNDPNEKSLAERRQFLRKLLPEDFFGVGLFGEGWTLVAHKDSPKTEEYAEASHRREIHQHPDRKEMRFGVFVLTDGRILHITRIRGEFPELQDSDKEADLRVFSGRIPDAMRLLCSACEEALR